MSEVHNLAISMIPGVGDVLAKALISHFGSAEAVFSACVHKLTLIPGIGSDRATQILRTDALLRAEQMLKTIKEQGIRLLFFQDVDYPSRLRNCIDAPVVLFYKGTADLNCTRIVSVVGTRNATEYGKNLCKQLIEALSASGALVISGLAYGIDVTVHKECLQASVPTIGVLGHGLDMIYPRLHQAVAHKMLLNGGLITEFPFGSPPDRENFPKRNRIIAGMADAVVVVEATRKGGALITAEIANSYNRDVYAFPGRTTDLFSEGCNFLVKTNRAGLLQHAKDLLYYLGWDAPEKTSRLSAQIEMPIGLDDAEQLIVKAVQATPLSIDNIGILTEIPQSKLAVILFNLEMKGILVSTPGNIYRLQS